MVATGGDRTTIHSERRARFDQSPFEVWAALERLPAYRHWWPWLRRFEADALADGERWTCTVRPSLPYQVRFDLVLHDIELCRSVSATIDGDIVGTARIDLEAIGGPNGATELTLVSDLAPSRTFLRSLTRVAGPVARYGHDQIVDRALAQFADHAL